MKTEISRYGGITAVWYHDRVLSAWDDRTGDSVGLFMAHAVTKDPPYPAPAVPMWTARERRLFLFRAAYRRLPDNRYCEHGLPRHLCMVCVHDSYGGLAY